MGLQRSRFMELRAFGTKPIRKPRLEILVRTLEAYPYWAISADQFLVDQVLELLNATRPGKSHTLRDLSVYLGYEASAVTPWRAGARMLPTAKRILRLMHLGLSQPHPDDRRHFLETFERIVSEVGAAHGISPRDLRARGFAGHQKARRAALSGISD